jgi:hypothetical protein
MPESPEPYLLAVALSAAVQLVLFLRWLYRRIRNDEIQSAFVRDMANNHLPYIYAALRLLCETQGVKLAEPPLVGWIELNGRPRNGR